MQGYQRTCLSDFSFIIRVPTQTHGTFMQSFHWKHVARKSDNNQWCEISVKCGKGVRVGNPDYCDLNSLVLFASHHRTTRFVMDKSFAKVAESWPKQLRKSIELNVWTLLVIRHRMLIILFMIEPTLTLPPLCLFVFIIKTST